MKTFNLRAIVVSPYLWALAGTPLPPLNLLLAVAFWIWSRFRHRALLFEAARCVNIQLTYLLIFALPIAVAFVISGLDRPEDPRASWTLAHRLATGFPLGILSLGGIVYLAFSNVRAFAAQVFAKGGPDVPRCRFIREL